MTFYTLLVFCHYIFNWGLPKYASFFTYYFGKLVSRVSLFDVFSVYSEIYIQRHIYGNIRFVITAFIDLLYIQVPSGHK